MQKTSAETEVIIIEGDASGKTLFVVGGIHGDETAGWEAAETLKKYAA